MIKLHIKKISFSQKTRDPLVLLSGPKDSRTIPISISSIDLPRIISFFYKLRLKENTVYSLFRGVLNQSPARGKKIILSENENGLKAELIYQILFFRKKTDLQVTDGLMVSLASDVPLYIPKELFHKIATTRSFTDLTEDLVYRSVLEKWHPEKMDVQSN